MFGCCTVLLLEFRRIMKGLQRIIVTLIVSLFFILYVRVIFMPYPVCEEDGFDLEPPFTYDRIGVGIQRSDVFIAGIPILRKVPLLIGIPTIYREYKNKTAFYLDQTIKSLIHPLGEDDKKDVRIVIILADREKDKQKFMYEKLKELFPKELKSGLLSIISIPDRFYLPLTNLPSTLGDTPQRMYWRSKQSLDYVFIFHYVQNLCQYYFQIEDDVLANDQYYTTVMDDIERFNRVRNRKDFFRDDESYLKFKPWIIAEYYRMGFIGRLIPSQYLPVLSNFIKILYKDLPVDWGYPHLLNMMGGLTASVYPELFVHIGKQSSSLGT